MSAEKLKTFLGLDQGTSSTKGMLIDESGRQIFEVKAPVSSRSPGEGMVEQDAMEILLGVCDVISNAKSFAQKHKLDIHSGGLSCQRSCVVPWDESLRPMAPVISWQDTRTKKAIEDLGADGFTIASLTGLPALPNYAGGKIALYQKQFPKAIVGTLDAFIRHALGGKLSMEETMAARSMLYSLRERAWSEKLCSVFGVDMNRLPRITPSFHDYGSLEGVRLSVSMGDQQAAWQSVPENAVLMIFGTVASVLVKTFKAAEVDSGFISSLLYSDGRTGQAAFYTETTAHCSGPTMELIFKELGLAKDAAQVNGFGLGPREGAPCAYMPISGTGATEWRTDLPCVSDLPMKDNKDFLWALIENLAFFAADDFLEMASEEPKIKSMPVVVSGGGSLMDPLLECLAAASGAKIHRLRTEQCSAFGAALAAAKSFNSNLSYTPELVEFAPKTDQSLIKQRFGRWRRMKTELLIGIRKNVFDPRALELA